MATVKRIAPERCFGAIIDVQEFFLAQTGKRRPAIKANIRHLARLLGYFRIPMVATVERPVQHKGGLPKDIAKALGARAAVLEKDFFDLTREKPIKDHIRRLRRKQAIVAGCETDVCVLQSCLGLLGLGYEVYVVEDLLFSSASEVDTAIARMQAAGAVMLTYKTLFYELVAAVDGGPHGDAMFSRYGEFPDDLPDAAG